MASKYSSTSCFLRDSRYRPHMWRLWQFRRASVMGEQMANMLDSFPMARRPDRAKADILSEAELKELRHNLAHLSVEAVRDLYDRTYRDCRLIYQRLPTP